MSLEDLDELGELGTPTGTLILNDGDPAFTRARQEAEITHQAEEQFVRLIAYLLFADYVVIPSRYVIDGPVMAQVMYWASSLLREGIVVPERRAGFASFSDVAAARGVGDAGRARADFLDQTALTTRTFQFDELGQEYVGLLGNDLRPEGAFRRIVNGGRHGKRSLGLDIAFDQYRESVDVTPEHFSVTVAAAVPELRDLSLRWAMARYYTTPLLFDQANTRQVPEHAARLLVRGQALDAGYPRFEKAAPVEHAYNRLAGLQVQLPNRQVSLNYEEYCQALLEVRREVPQARESFRQIRDLAALDGASTTAARDFERELDRQLKVKASTDWKFVLSSSLAGGAAGYGASVALDPTPAAQVMGALGSSIVSGFASAAAARRIAERLKQSRQPWIVAVDRMENNLKR